VVSPEIANELLRGEIELGGEEKVATILFSDIRGFTKACEGEKPERILTLLNIYLTEVANIIEERNGVVDKFIGDAVMALFGAPVASDRDPQNAVQAALDMCIMLRRLNVDLEARGYLNLDIGIGINTGPLVAGNMGSENRLNYTVIGDNVNLSSRLEGLTKFYGVKVIVSETTYSLCEGIPFLFIDHVRVKGKKSAVRIFAPLEKAIPPEEEESYGRCLEKYSSGDFQAADQGFSTLFEEYKRELYRMYALRCRQLIDNPPSAWDGVHTFTSK
jgi:adenylate cyclase